VNDSFLHVLSEILSMSDYLRGDVLPGLDLQPPSKALDFILLYFISELDNKARSLTISESVIEIPSLGRPSSNEGD
jgi:hypothetical protein